MNTTRLPLVTVSRRLTFCAGHRVFGHENKCANPHGHNYEVIIEAQARDGLDTLGRVIDFAVLKERVGGWLNTWWDHAFIVHQADAAMVACLEALGGRMYALPMNPTAENLAVFLLGVVCPNELKGTDVVVFRVTVVETENCRAVAEVGALVTCQLTPAEWDAGHPRAENAT